MNPQLACDLAISRARELQHMSDQYVRRSDPREPATVSGRHRPSALRHQIGFTLLEAGLRLLAN
jgi:hypothetical protein